MKFTIEKEGLIKSLKSAAGVASHKTSLPILSFARLSAVSSKISIYVTDMEMGFQACHLADVQEAGEICLPAKVLYDIINKLPGGPIEFATDDKPAMTIRATSGVYNIFGLCPDDFPTGPALAEEVYDVRNLLKKECTTRVDIRLLCSVVEVTHEDEIIIDLSEGTNPVQVMNISALEIEEKDYLGIVMPLVMN